MYIEKHIPHQRQATVKQNITRSKMFTLKIVAWFYTAAYTHTHTQLFHKYISWHTFNVPGLRGVDQPNIEAIPMLLFFNVIYVLCSKQWDSGTDGYPPSEQCKYTKTKEQRNEKYRKTMRPAENAAHSDVYGIDTYIVHSHTVKSTILISNKIERWWWWWNNVIVYELGMVWPVLYRCHSLLLVLFDAQRKRKEEERKKNDIKRRLPEIGRHRKDPVHQPITMKWYITWYIVNWYSMLYTLRCRWQQCPILLIILRHTISGFYSHLMHLPRSRIHAVLKKKLDRFLCPKMQCALCVRGNREEQWSLYNTRHGRRWPGPGDSSQQALHLIGSRSIKWELCMFRRSRHQFLYLHRFGATVDWYKLDGYGYGDPFSSALETMA